MIKAKILSAILILISIILTMCDVNLAFKILFVFAILTLLFVVWYMLSILINELIN